MQRHFLFPVFLYSVSIRQKLKGEMAVEGIPGKIQRSAGLH